jgi:very-short-patch-repair endonuclease
MIKFIKRFIFGTTRRELDAQLAKCESPIEAMFLEAAWPVLSQYGRIATQYRLGYYLIDVAMPELNIAIEIDEREYHNSELQTENDKARDRVLMRSGWQTIRYPGREVYADAAGCVREVEAIINRQSGGR